MSLIIKKIIKDLTPPFLWKMLRMLANKNNRPTYYGDYRNWGEAKKMSAGYEKKEILSKVRQAIFKVKNRETAFERDSVTFDHIQYSWPLLAFLLWVAGNNNNRLSVIDFGGSLGSSYYQNLEFLKHLKKLRWCIVEQKHFVEAGKKDFENEQLTFYDNLSVCIQKEQPDIILLSNVLQYIEEPYKLLEDIKKQNVKYIIIDWIPFLKDDLPDRLTIQRVSPKIYNASYPAWFFNEKKMLFFLTQQFELITTFESSPTPVFTKSDQAIFKGLIFKQESDGP